MIMGVMSQSHALLGMSEIRRHVSVMRLVVAARLIQDTGTIHRDHVEVSIAAIH